MAIQKIWATWMPQQEGVGDPAQTLAPLGRYGVQLHGARWRLDLKQLSWAELGTQLLDPAQADGWLIAGTRADFESRDNRYALSLLAAMVREGRGASFPVFVLSLDTSLAPEEMPFLTRGFRFLSAQEPTWPARILAAGLQAPPPAWPFHINVYGHPFVGQWFEVGPREETWEGALFGVSEGAQVTYHLVGSRGQLPEKCTLEYPVEGITAEIRGIQFNASSVQNRIDPEQSYYVQVEGYPEKIFFGGSPDTEHPEVTVIDLV